MLFKICLAALFCILNFKNGFGYDILNCSSTTPKYSLKSNTLTFLQTPNFPRTVFYNTETIPCNAEIQSTDHIWITFLNGQTNSISIYGSQNTSNVLQKSHYSSNTDTLSFTTPAGSLFVKLDEKFSEDSWTAFQAAIVSFSIDTVDQCPFSTQTFDFYANPDIIVPVVSEWKKDNALYISKFCNWVFKIGPTQQLKIVVKSIKQSSDFILALNENGNIIKNYVNYAIIEAQETICWNMQILFIASKFAYSNNPIWHFSFTDSVNDIITPGLYFSGSNFNLTFSNQWSNSSDSNFFLIVSAFTPSKITIPSGCLPPNTTGSATIFSNMDKNSGYQPYQHCENSFKIPENHEVSLVITQPYYEACCDKLSIKYGGNINQVITWVDGKPNEYKFNHVIGDVTLSFDSDGNNQQAGYVAVVQPYECKCGPQKTVVQCNGNTGIFPTAETLYYCDNMICNYQIQNSGCPNSYISVLVEHYLRPQTDHLILKSNGQFNYDFTNNTKYLSPAYISDTYYYSSKNNVTLDFTSGSAGTISMDPKSWAVYVNSIPSPNFINITLDQNKSKHVQWLADMNENDALRVCAKTGTLEIFVTYNEFPSLYHFALYDSDDLYNFVGLLSSDALNSSSPYIPPNRKSTSGCFTLYFNSEVVLFNSYTVLFRILEENTKNCQDPNNVFQMFAIKNNPQTQYDVSIQSKASGECEMIILAFVFELPHVWISNITGNAKYIFKSTVTDKKLFDVDGSEASQWQSFGIYTPALSILAPASSGISVHLTNADQNLAWITLIDQGTQKGAMASPSYAGFLQKFDTFKLYQSNTFGLLNTFKTDFVIKEITGNPNLLIEFNGSNQTLNKNMTIETSEFSIFYEETNPSTNGFLIEYTIQTTNNSASGIKIGYLLSFAMIMALINLF